MTWIHRLRYETEAAHVAHGKVDGSDMGRLSRGVLVVDLLVGLSVALAMAACSNTDDSDSSPENAEIQSEITAGPSAISFNQGWRVDQHVRLVRDVTGDRRADLVGFGDAGVYVAETGSDGLTSPLLAFADLGNAQGWTPASTIRTLADVNGDGLLDIVGLGLATVEVALKNAGPGYRAPIAWTSDFALQRGWDMTAHARFLGDVDGDGRSDLVGIHDAGVYVSRSIGTAGPISITAASSFQFISADNAGASPLVANRTAASAWEGFQLVNNMDGTVSLQALVNGRYITTDLANGGRLIASKVSIGMNEKFRMVPQSNGAVGFQAVANNQWVSADLNLSGTLIANRPSPGVWEFFILNGFAPKALWLAGFSKAQGWDPAKHPRTVADLDHDGRADIVGFGDDGVYVARSTGTSFSPAVKVSPSFGYNDGWRIGPHLRLLANVNGDPYLDIVGFGPTGVVVALGNTSGFGAATTWSTDFGDNAGWTTDRHVRLVGDVDGDGRDDIVGIKDDHVYVARSTGVQFGTPVVALDDFTYGKGWRVDKHPRMLADVDGDGQVDLVGFFDDAIYWDRLAPPPTSDWIHPVCDTPALGPPVNDPQACNGSWAYTYREIWNNPDACGSPSCAQFQSCTSWDLNQQGDGAGYTVESSTAIGPTQTYMQSEVLNSSRGARPEDECPREATSKLDELIAMRPGISPQARAGLTVTYDNFEILALVTDPALSLTYRCHFTIHNFPTPMTGAHPWCGCTVQAIQPECARVDGTFASTDVPKNIPDNNSAGATSTVTVPAAGDVKKVVVNVDITHTFRGNLEISVIAPNGKIAMLSNRQGGAAHNYVAAGLDISGSFTPGTPAAGAWKLQVRDLAGADVGTINSFSLSLLGSSPMVTTVVTEPGAHLPIGPGPASPGALRREFVQAPVCQTCDSIPVDSNANVQAKFTCLDNGMAAGTGSLKASLAARMKLLWQLAGDRLTADQRARAETLYNEDAASGPSCSTPVVWDAACRTQDLASLPGQLQLCQDLAGNDRTTPAIASAEFQHCLDQFKALGELNDSCQIAMRDTGAAMAERLLKKTQPSFAGDFSAVLPAAFARLAAWWQTAVKLAQGDQAWLGARASMLERWLWATIEAQHGPLPQTNPTTDSQAAALLADIASNRMKDDVAILNSAFAPGQTTSAPPLLTLVGDALKMLADRLERLEPVHDVGCRFLPCLDPRTGAVVSTATSQLLRVLASLPDASALTTELAAARDLQTQQPELYRALVNVRDQHAYLETAWSLFGRPEPLTKLATLSNPPAEAEGLSAIVRAASLASASYQATGEFLPWNRPRLTAAALRQSDLVGFLNGLAATTDSQKALYTQQRLDTVNDLLNQSRTGAALQSQVDQIGEMVAHASDIAARIDGIEQRDLTERAALAGFQATFDALTTSGVVDPGMAYQTQVVPVFGASGGDSHYPNVGDRNVVRDQFHMERLGAGQTMRVHISGQWSPTCAITNGNIADSSTGLPVSIVLGASKTGPEGFYVVAENHRYSTGSVGVSGGGPGPIGKATSSCASDSLNFSACTFADLPKGGDSSFGQTAAGADTRLSAVFSSGLRLSTTPYPEAPVGSMVAVITRKGVTGAASDPPPLDIRVVHADDVIVAANPPPLTGWPNDGEIEIHFVVNDRAQNPDGTPCARPDTSALQIELTRSTPLGNVAQPVGAAMSTALAALAAETPAVIAQGELSSSEATALRDTAWTRVQQALLPLGIGLAGLPAELRQLFDTHVERELASIARRAQRNALQQELMQLVLQIDAIKRQQAFTTDQNRLLFLIPRWRLRDLAGVKLAGSAAALAEALTAYAAPVFDLRDPASASNFRALVTAEALSLTRDLQITGPYEDAVDDLVTFARHTASAIGGAQFELPTSQRRTIVIAVPRPPGTGRAAWTGSWQAVSATTAKAFWDSVFDVAGAPSGNAVLTLSPPDIYSEPGGALRLACMDLAPVVRHAGFYFDTAGRSSALGPAGIEIVTTAAIISPISFPLQGSLMSFTSTDPLGIPMRIRALNGAMINVIQDANGNPLNFGIWPQDLDAGAGISPFTSFRLDMRVFGPQASTAVRDVLANATAMFAVFEVERRTANVGAWMPGVCGTN